MMTPYNSQVRVIVTLCRKPCSYSKNYEIHGARKAVSQALEPEVTTARVCLLLIGSCSCCIPRLNFNPKLNGQFFFFFLTLNIFVHHCVHVCKLLWAGFVWWVEGSGFVVHGCTAALFILAAQPSPCQWGVQNTAADSDCCFITVMLDRKLC